MLNTNFLAEDTIVAQASANGRGGVGIVRLSGPNSYHIAQNLRASGQGEKARSLSPRKAELATWYSDDGSIIDQGICLYFPGPHSFTGEDVIELQAHGGVVLMDWLVQRCLALGARLARPGEFSERAFLNGKLDLAQAESIADLIDAASREAVVCASRSLQGAFSTQVNSLLEQLVRIRTHIEAAIDFVDEDLETDDIAQIAGQLHCACDQVNTILSRAETGVRLHEGARIAIVGAPNAGKSSLMNYLAQTSAAIVSDIPGTTRDIVKERIVLKGIPVEILDTAGLRTTSDPIEQQGIARAQAALEMADLVLWVFDVADRNPQQALLDYQLYLGSIDPKQAVICLGNKMDLLDKSDSYPSDSYDIFQQTLCLGAINTGQGMSELIDAVMAKLGVRSGQEGQFIARRRHVDALEKCLQYLESARSIVHVQPLEIVAEELRLAHDALAMITGEFTSDDLLGKIFSSFCVGK